MLELLKPATTNVLVGAAPTEDGQPIAPLDEWGHDRLWWLDRMVRSRNQLVERMTLNLHDLFATSTPAWATPATCCGRTVCCGATRWEASPAPAGDHARPGDAAVAERRRHNKWEPNENYAREVMELFCLGNDPAWRTLTHGLWTYATGTRKRTSTTPPER